MDNSTAPMDFADLAPEDVASRIADAARTSAAICATPYGWPDARSLPTRQWLLGNWLLKGEVTAIIAPGGTGKSTISGTMALSLASGKPLLGQSLPRGPQAVWIFNLEDGTDELERQMAAACAFHDIGPEDCGDRLHLDSGLVQPLCTASEDREGFTLAEEVFAQLAVTIKDRQIATVVVDPFVSSHAVQENSNGAIDAIAKRWKRLAQETGCAIALVHHTKKLGDREVTAEDGRGASALPAAARVVLTLNRMIKAEANRLGIAGDDEWKSLVRIDMGKSNRAPPGSATWIKLESHDLGNGNWIEVSDKVAVVRIWHRPKLSQLAPEMIREIRELVGAGTFGENCQAKDWVGHAIADVWGLSVIENKSEIKAIQQQLRALRYLTIERRQVNGKERPFAVVGEASPPSDPDAPPHSDMCGAEGAEGADGAP